MSADLARALTCCAALAVIATWTPAVLVLDPAAVRVYQRRLTLRPLVGFRLLTASVVITSLVCVGLGIEMIGGPDRPTICVGTDELGLCRPTVDRSGPATPQAMHAIYVLAGIALLGLAADALLLVTGQLRIHTLTRCVEGMVAAENRPPNTSIEKDSSLFENASRPQRQEHIT